jgi:CRP-like cAMP-binding protein
MLHINSYIENCLENPSSLFKGLSQKEKESIVQHHTVATVKKGGYLFREGEKGRGLVYLVSGKAKVCRTGVAGREHIINMLNEQDLTGFRTLFTETTWTASAVAIEETIICTVEKHNLLRILRSNPEILMKIGILLSEELSYSYNKMVSLTQKHVRGRLVESLLMLAGIYGFEVDGKTIRACLSRSDLAHLSNMTTSNAIRTLSNLVSEGNIKIKGRRITLLNIPVLEKISDQA